MEAADTDAEAVANVGVAVVQAAEAAAPAAAGTPAARRQARAPRAAATPRRRAAATPVAAAAATPAGWAAGKGRRMIRSRTARSVRLTRAVEGWGECVAGGWDGRVGARRVMCSLVPFSPQAYARGCSLRFAPSLMRAGLPQGKSIIRDPVGRTSRVEIDWRGFEVVEKHLCEAVPCAGKRNE